MKKVDLVNTVLENCEEINANRKMVNAIIELTFDTISKELKSQGRVGCSSFGTFKVSRRKARIGRNPRTGEPIKIKAGKSVSFKPSQILRNAL
ncbi:MAG: HU family DNA-binding protein [Candidatus Poseidoniia archaeon]|jgi:nucleoid DNA-binding protein|nr:HU family DNA-binding protein [Candidatus Poseidoniia archaeon]